MYTGEFDHTVDSKGRLILPSKLRDSLGEEFVVTRGVDGCLFVYDKTEWSRIEEIISNLSYTSDKERKARRFFLSKAEYVGVDKQGRFLIPSKLREYAALEKDVVIVGCGRNIEIWNKDRWDDINSDDDIEEVMEYLNSVGVRL